MRLEVDTPSARSLPPLICGTPVAVSVIIMSICPPSRSVIAFGLLLYGTCRISVCDSCLNISPATRLDELPLPKLSLPGSLRALASRSATLL